MHEKTMVEEIHEYAEEILIRARLLKKAEHLIAASELEQVVFRLAEILGLA